MINNPLRQITPSLPAVLLTVLHVSQDHSHYYWYCCLACHQPGAEKEEGKNKCGKQTQHLGDI